MKTARQILALLCIASALGAHAQDSLEKFLKAKGMSNVPYTEQGKAHPGGYVSYDTEHTSDVPDWYQPVDDEGTIVPLIDKHRDNILIPKETVKTMKDGDLELSLFGFHPFADIQTTGTLEYDQMTLTVNALMDNNSFYNHLLTPGSLLEKEVLAYGSETGTPRLYSNQHIYLILSTFSTDAIKMKSTGGKILGFSSGGKLAKCPTIDGSPVTSDNTGGATETTASMSAGGAFRYCQRDETTVELHSANGKPVQVGAQLLRIVPDGTNKWRLRQRVVLFEGKKTIE